MSDFAKMVADDLIVLRARTPIVHSITNLVVTNYTANALLAVGAAPIMAHAPEELAEIVAISGALVINIGTLDKEWITSMFEAMHHAKAKGIPIVLDPVGAGASRLRTGTALMMLDKVTPDIVRGNASEIRALVVAGAATRGVDSTISSDKAEAPARELAQKYGIVVSVSGEIDYIISKTGCTKVHNGHPIMPKVTGLGCTATALTGAFAAVVPDKHRAAASAMAVMGIAGEMAFEEAKGPGSFGIAFLDALSCLNPTIIEQKLRMSD